MTRSAASTLSLDDLASRLRAIQWHVSTQLDNLEWAQNDVPTEQHFAYAQLVGRVRELVSRIDRLAQAAQSASQQYAWREGILNSAAEQATGHLLWLAGRVLPGLLVTASPELLLGAGVIVGAIVIYRSYARAHPTNAQRTEVFLKRNFGAVGAQLTALAVSGTDNFVAGLVSMPEPHSSNNGPQQISAIATGASTLFAASALTETNVQVKRVAAHQQPAPETLANLVSRIPHGEYVAGADSPSRDTQVRIEKYAGEGSEGSSGADTYVVYVGGTVDSSLQATDQPWDMTSNVTAMAGGDAASERAVTQAMIQAGIGPGDDVILVGHSQGGLIAARLAQSSNFHVTNVVTVGAPIHNIGIPDSTHVLSIEHTEDVVPSLSGVTVGVGGVAAGMMSSAQSHDVLVRNSTFNDHAPRAGTALAAHSLQRYVATARQLDQSADPQAMAARQDVLEQIGRNAGPAEVTLWRATRTH